MTDNKQKGDERRAGMNPEDQSLDRGFGGLPGKDATETADDDTVTKRPAKEKVREAEPRPYVPGRW